MLRTIVFFIKLALSLIMIMPIFSKVKKMKQKNDPNTDYFIFDFVKGWAEKRLKATKSRVHVIGIENIPDENVLFVSNHQSNLDFLLLLAKINKPIGFVAKIELEKIPLLRDWMRAINCVFIDRNDMRQQVKTIVEGIKLLKEGKSLVIFPEGTRSKNGNIMDFKAGSFKLATKSKVPIVPLTIDGTFKSFEGNDNKLISNDFYLYIHKPVYIDKIPKEDAENINNYVRDIIKKPLEEKTK